MQEALYVIIRKLDKKKLDESTIGVNTRVNREHVQCICDCHCFLKQYCSTIVVESEMQMFDRYYTKLVNLIYEIWQSLISISSCKFFICYDFTNVNESLVSNSSKILRLQHVIENNDAKIPSE